MTIDRTIKPSALNDISFSLPEIETFTLENGLKIDFVKKDKLPIIQMNLVTDAGSKLDPADKKGLANLFSMMIDEGAGPYDPLQLSDEFDTLGTNFNVFTTSDSVYLSMQTLKENFDRSLELFGTVITKPHFDDSAFAREQRKILTRLMQVKDDPEEIADSVFEYLLFGKANPYAYRTAGYEESIPKISNDDVKNYYQKFFLPNNAFMIVVGDSTRNELEDKLNKYFGDWKSGVYTHIAPTDFTENTPQIYIANKANSVQTEIRIGHLSNKRNENDYFPKLLLNSILGGQFTSRINLNLRENKGYTYGASSRFSYYKDNAFFQVNTSVGIENTVNAVNEILKELNGIKKGVTNEELEFAKSSIIRKFPSNFETNKQIASNLTGKIIHSLPDDYFNTYLDNVKKINIDDVNNAAQKYIFPEKLIIVLVGDKEQIKTQLVETKLGSYVETDLKGEIIS